jgi:hypothetical protein
MTSKIGRGAPAEVLRCAGAAAGFAIDEMTQAAFTPGLPSGRKVDGKQDGRRDRGHSRTQ